MNTLIILGNGFDLAHGRKTSYRDFINFIVESHFKNRENFSDLFVVNKNINEIQKFYTLIKGAYGENVVKTKNPLFMQLLTDFALYNWCDIEEKYYQILVELKP